ncbi:uncharacterized protein SAPINGB_P003579 [Magnusiomyces paraingens]|uniref:Glutaredoxin domain-containing protein n=1 Tax=Magnusiomyces paraingens TaxID=2606893 RepID=A0A5E8BSC5_9ASCO|nr:uncharacterized protein SAPINGB_P003579 [Saprochaete ingens]VVT53449.1 unnamed protein product [Saprochaete ingens]
MDATKDPSSSSSSPTLFTILFYALPLFMVLKSLYTYFFSSPKMVSPAALSKAQALIDSNKVFVASKSYCPYCKATKNLLNQVGVRTATIIELNETEDGAEIQDALEQITGQRTVPNIFISGKHIGGNSDIQSLNSRDQLVPALQAAGAL